MKKIILLLLLITVFTSGFTIPKKFKYGIIFIKVPFTRETAGSYTRSFAKGERIYWLFMSNKPIKANFIKVQVVSATDKGPWNTLSGIVYTNEYRINKDSPHFFTDYVVMHTGGHYYMEIFDKNMLHKPLVVADFYVK